MPGARRVRKGQTGRGPDSQIRRGTGREGNGPQTFDGASRTTAGTTPPTRPAPASATVVKS